MFVVKDYTMPIVDVKSVLQHSASLVESMESISLDSDESSHRRGTQQSSSSSLSSSSPLSSDSSGSGSCVGRVGRVWQTA